MFSRILFSALALSLAAPVAAAPTTVTVPYSDLDLTKEAGRQTLEARVDRAVRKVCGGAAPVRSLAQMQSYRACIAEARTATRDQVELALNAANARRVAVLADKLGLLASF